MSDTPSLIDRLKQARIVQVLVVYVGASWAVLQLVDTVTDMLSLPEWLGPVTLVLLAVGLLVVTATAWVQSLDATTRAEEAGEVPTDWHVDPADVIASLRSGRLPHLTWGRAILGGVVALSLAVGAAGAYVLVTGGGGLIGPTEASADASSSAIAVLPFQTRGAELEVYGEGMVDLLSANLEGLGGLRTIDAGTVIARWKSRIGDDFTAELSDALGVAGSLDARFAIRGSIVPAGATVRLSVDIFDLADGKRVDGVQIEGTQDDFLELVDALTIDLAQRFLGNSVDRAGPTSASTHSVAALRAYLRGNTFYRQARFVEAIGALNEAVAIDPDFALAWWRLADAWGWETISAPEYIVALERSKALAHRLPERERLLVEVNAGLTEGDRSSIGPLRDYLSSHPNDGEAWNALAEFGEHAPWLSFSSPEEHGAAIRKAVALMPTFPPVYTHAVHLEANENHKAEFDRLVGALEDHGVDPAVVEATRLYWDFFRGSDAEQAEAESFFRTASTSQRTLLGYAFAHSDDLGRRFLVTRSLGSLGSGDALAPGAADLQVGIGPAEWPADGAAPGRPESYRAYTELNWVLLTGVPAAVPSRVRSLLDGTPGASAAASVAMYAGAVGDVALRDRALGLLDRTDLAARGSIFAMHGGAATAEEARRNATALGLLREGRGSEAQPLVRQNLDQASYDAISVLIAGDVAAASGEWADAVRYFESLLLTEFRASSRLRLGRAHEAAGDTARSLANYRGFLTMWDGGDEALAPMIEARAAVARLGG